MNILDDEKAGKKPATEKSIRFPLSVHRKLLKLCERLNRNQVQLFAEMVEYFYKTKKDPADISDEMLKAALTKNHDTYIRFIRAQEEKVLIPVKVEVDRMIQSQIKILDFFNNHVLKANKDLLSNQQTQVQKFLETDKLLKAISEKQETKESLKLKFLYILNNYSKVRESFSFTTSAKDKEELIQQTRQQVAKL